jgi:hypothetical protein
LIFSDPATQPAVPCSKRFDRDAHEFRAKLDSAFLLGDKMSAMQRVLACVVTFGLASGCGLAAQAPEPPLRILIVADELSLQFRSTPRVRDQMRHMLQVFRRNGALVGITSTGHSRLALLISGNWDTLDSAVSRVLGEALSPRAIANATATSEDGDELRLRAATAFSTAATALRSASGSGPVTVVYLTEGYPALVPEPSEFVQEALRVRATIYAIDPRGFSETDKQFDAKDWEAYVAATHSSVRTLASRTKGSAVFTRGEFDTTLSALAKTIR